MVRGPDRADYGVGPRCRDDDRVHATGDERRHLGRLPGRVAVARDGDDAEIESQALRRLLQSAARVPRIDGRIAGEGDPHHGAPRFGVAARGETAANRYQQNQSHRITHRP